MKFGGYFFYFIFVPINFNCSNVSLWLCSRGEVANVKWSALGPSLPAQGDRKDPALVYKLTHTRSVFSWMSSPSQCSECDCAMSTPRCHDYKLRLMRQTALRSARRRAPRCPLSVTFLWGAISRRVGQCSFSGSESTWALYPCPHIKRPPSLLLQHQPSASCHQVSLATVAAATALITASWFEFRMLNRQEQNGIEFHPRAQASKAFFCQVIRPIMFLVKTFDLFTPTTIFLAPLTSCHWVMRFTCLCPPCI